MFNGNKLKILRLSKNLTQKELGKILNVSNSTINHYECNTNQPDTIMLKKICNYFDVSADFLINSDDFTIQDEDGNIINLEDIDYEYILLAKEAYDKGISKKTLQKIIDAFSID